MNLLETFGNVSESFVDHSSFGYSSNTYIWFLTRNAEKAKILSKAVSGFCILKDFLKFVYVLKTFDGNS